MDEFDAAWNAVSGADEFDAAWNAISKEPEPKSSFFSLDYGGKDTTAGDVIMGAGQGLLRGLGKTALLPADALVWAEKKALEALGYEPEVTYPSEAVDLLVDKLAGSYDSRQAQNVGGRTAQTVGEFVGSVPGMAGLGKQLAATGVKGVSGLGKALSENIGAQQRAAAAAGLGAAYAKENAPDSVTAQIALPLVVGTAYSGLGNVFKRGASGLADIFSKPRAAQSAKVEAKKIAERFVDSPKVQEALARRAAEEAKVPLIQRRAETYLPQYQRTAEAAGEPGMALLEQTLRKDAKSLAGIENLESAMFDQDTLREAARQKIFKQAQKVSGDATEAGIASRTALSAAEEAAAAKVTEQAAKAFKGGEEIITTPAKASLTATINQITKSGARKVSSDLQEVVDNFRALPKKVDLRTLQDYRSKFGEFAGQAKALGATTQMKQDAKIANTLRDRIDDAIVNRSNLKQPQVNAYKKFIELRKNQGTLYQGDSVADVLQEKSFGRGYEIDDSQVVKSLIKTPEDTDRVLAALPKGAEGQKAKEALRAAKMQEVYDKAAKDIVIGSKPQSKLAARTFGNEVDKLEKITGKLLLPSQRKALNLIKNDLLSEEGVAALASRASKGQPTTAQALTTIGALQKAATASANSNIFNRIPILRVIPEAIQAAVGTGVEARKVLINRELMRLVMEPKYAPILLSTPNPKELQKLVPALAAALSQSAPVASRLAEEQQMPEEEGGIDYDYYAQELMGENDAKKKAPSVAAPEPKQPEAKAPITEKERVRAVEAVIDADPYYSALYEAESSRNPRAQPIDRKTGKLLSSAKGGFQLINSTAKSLGVEDPYDLAQSFEGAKKLTEEHARKFKTNDPAELYSLHYLGEGVYRKWKAGKELNKLEREQVEYLLDRALPRFMGIYNKKARDEPSLA